MSHFMDVNTRFVLNKTSFVVVVTIPLNFLVKILLWHFIRGNKGYIG